MEFAVAGEIDGFCGAGAPAAGEAPTCENLVILVCCSTGTDFVLVLSTTCFLKNPPEMLKRAIVRMRHPRAIYRYFLFPIFDQCLIRFTWTLFAQPSISFLCTIAVQPANKDTKPETRGALDSCSSSFFVATSLVATCEAAIPDSCNDVSAAGVVGWGSTTTAVLSVVIMDFIIELEVRVS